MANKRAHETDILWCETLIKNFSRPPPSSLGLSPGNPTESSQPTVSRWLYAPASSGSSKLKRARLTQSSSPRERCFLFCSGHLQSPRHSPAPHTRPPCSRPSQSGRLAGKEKEETTEVPPLNLTAAGVFMLYIRLLENNLIWLFPRVYAERHPFFLPCLPPPTISCSSRQPRKHRKAKGCPSPEARSGAVYHPSPLISPAAL